MDLNNMTIGDLHLLADRVDLAVRIADELVERFGDELAIDLTSPARLCLPVFANAPKVAVAPEPVFAVHAVPTFRHTPTAVETPTNRNGEPWSEAEDQAIVDGLVTGRTPREIADSLGRTIEATRFRISKPLKDRIAAAKARGTVSKAVTPLALATDGLQKWERDIHAAQDAIAGEDIGSPALDLALVEGLGKGISLADLAEEHGISADAARTRWVWVTSCVRSSGGVMDAEGQTRLLSVLRARVAAAPSVAA